VSRIDLDRIRERFRLRQYDMSAHAMEEMAEGLLTIEDIESAILSGRVSRIEKDDPRGTRYTIDRQTPVGVVGRFASSEVYLVITVYEVTEFEGKSYVWISM
jgi:Domain of unknown function (DUF4258)